MNLFSKKNENQNALVMHTISRAECLLKRVMEFNVDICNMYLGVSKLTDLILREHICRAFVLSNALHGLFFTAFLLCILNKN